MKHARKVWGNIVWFLFFTIGVLVSLLYVQGWRLKIETGEVIPTGILDLSYLPRGGIIFLDGELIGENPITMRGLPLQVSEIRVEKSGFRTVEQSTPIHAELVTHILGFHLTPSAGWQVQPLGNEEMLFWDPERKGYILLFPQEKFAQKIDIVEKTKTIQEFPFVPQGVTFLENGELEFRSQTGEFAIVPGFRRQLFRSFPDLVEETQSSVFRKKRLNVGPEAIFLTDSSTALLQKTVSLKMPILGAWWMPNSDDILILTEEKAFFWNYFLEESREIATFDKVDSGFFVPDVNTLFYKQNKTWNSIFFGEE